MKKAILAILLTCGVILTQAQRLAQTPPMGWMTINKKAGLFSPAFGIVYLMQFL